MLSRIYFTTCLVIFLTSSYIYLIDGYPRSKSGNYRINFGQQQQQPIQHQQQQQIYDDDNSYRYNLGDVQQGTGVIPEDFNYLRSNYNPYKSSFGGYLRNNNNNDNVNVNDDNLIRRLESFNPSLESSQSLSLASPPSSSSLSSQSFRSLASFNNPYDDTYSFNTNILLNGPDQVLGKYKNYYPQQQQQEPNRRERQTASKSTATTGLSSLLSLISPGTSSGSISRDDLSKFLSSLQTNNKLINSSPILSERLLNEYFNGIESLDNNNNNNVANGGNVESVNFPITQSIKHPELPPVDRNFNKNIKHKQSIHQQQQQQQRKNLENTKQKQKVVDNVNDAERKNQPIVFSEEHMSIPYDEIEQNEQQSKNINLRNGGVVVNTNNKIGQTANLMMDQHMIRAPKSYQKPLNSINNNNGLHSTISNLSDIYFIAIVVCVSSVAIFSVIGAGYCFYKVQQSNKASADVDFPAYGVIGPASRNDDSGINGNGNGSKCSSPSNDRKLVQSAQIYHYHHQKQQMISTEKNVPKSNGGNGGSDIESDEENEDGEYTVYECPGLAPTGEMEIKNPLFQDDLTPMSSPSVNGSISKGNTPKGSSDLTPSPSTTTTSTAAAVTTTATASTATSNNKNVTNTTNTSQLGQIKTNETKKD